MSTHLPSFWDYSLAVYGQENVAEACLSLQNRYGFDVNLVLFCLWYGEYFSSTMPQSLLTDAIKLSRHWSEMSVKPLRRIRTDIKSDDRLQQLSAAPAINELREKIKDLELQAEKLQQNLLEELAYACSEAQPVQQTDHAPQNETEQSHHNLLALTAAMALKPEPALESIMAVVLANRASKQS